MPEPVETCATYIAKLRKAKGLSQRELARRIGKSHTEVSRWERAEGGRTPTSVAAVFGLACALATKTDPTDRILYKLCALVLQEKGGPRVDL